MASEAFAGVGTKFQRWDGAAWQDIAEVNSIDGPGMTKDVLEVTSLDTDAGYNEFITGFAEGGTLTLDMNFTRETYELMKEDFESDEVRSYRIQLPDYDSEPSTFTIEGLVIELPITMTADDKVTADVVIQITSQVILDVGSIEGDEESWSSYWATQFATAAGITDAGQIAIVKDLCADFAAAGLWDKMKAIYPFIGGTADAHKINLKDPRDADDAFRITWTGTITHSALGIKGNGTDGWGNTHLVFNENLAFDSYSYSVYSRDDTNASNRAVEIEGGPGAIIIYRDTYAGGAFIAGQTFASLAIAAYNNSKGLFTVDRVANNQAYAIRNGTVFFNITDTVTDTDSAEEIYLLVANNNGSPSTYFNSRQIGFACISEGLTVYEEQLKYAIIRKYINAMDNLAAYNNQILFESWQPATLDQVSLTLKINTGHKVYIDWGEDDPVEITGDGSEVTVTSDYGTGSKTYYGRIYGELTELIKFKINNEPTLAGLNINDFRRLNVPLYELYINTPKSVFIDLAYLPQGLTILNTNTLGAAYYGKGSANDLPVYLQQWLHQGSAGFTMDDLTALPSSLSQLSIISWTKEDVDIDNLPANLSALTLTQVTGATGSLRNLPATMTGISIINCGTGINITTTPLKAWATTNITLTSAYTTASVDGFFNAYAAVAADGAATLNLAGTGTGIANQADSAASSAAQVTLAGLSKTIQTN